jgi:hypothetical protein
VSHQMLQGQVQLLCDGVTAVQDQGLPRGWLVECFGYRKSPLCRRQQPYMPRCDAVSCSELNSNQCGSSWPWHRLAASCASLALGTEQYSSLRLISSLCGPVNVLVDSDCHSVACRLICGDWKPLPRVNLLSHPRRTHQRTFSSFERGAP